MFKDLIICSRMKCSVNLATSNSTEVRKWSDSVSFFPVLKIPSLLPLCRLKERESQFQQWIELNAWHSIMSIRANYFLCSSNSHLSVPLQQQTNEQERPSGFHSTRRLFLPNLTSISLLLDPCTSSFPPLKTPTTPFPFCWSPFKRTFFLKKVSKVLYFFPQYVTF